jgi:hypothetical protein
MFQRLFLLVVLLISLAGCDAFDTMKEGFAHSEAVSAQLEKTVGLKSQVGFNWVNGSLTSVNVTFAGMPTTGTLSEIAEKTKQAIRSEFKQTPKHILISFSIEP